MTTEKIKSFIKRNRVRNSSLYNESLVEDYDFVVCPVSGERMKMIKSTYITKVLEMDVADFDAMYPNQLKVAHSRSDKIAASMDQDSSDGVSKKQQRANKISSAMQTITEDGISLAVANAQKAKLTKGVIGDDGLSLAQRTARKAIISGNKTKVLNGQISSTVDHFKWYKNLVLFLLGDNLSESVLMVKIKDAFDNFITPFAVVSESNLVVSDNKHNSKSSRPTEHLLGLLNMTYEESRNEFVETMNFCDKFYEEHGAMSYGEIITRIKNAGVRTER